MASVKFQPPSLINVHGPNYDFLRIRSSTFPSSDVTVSSKLSLSLKSTHSSPERRNASSIDNPVSNDNLLPCIPPNGLDLNRRLISFSLANIAFSVFSPACNAEEANVLNAQSQLPESTNPLIQRLLESSRANKEKYDKERLDGYYKRNFKDYFEFVEGSILNKQNPSEAEKGILEWLEKNR